jgi:hypothetical protein
MHVAVKTVFDDLGVGIMIHDPEMGDIVGVNDRLTELMGYSETRLCTFMYNPQRKARDRQH